MIILTYDRLTQNIEHPPNRSFGNASVNDRVVFVALIRHDLYEGGLNCLLLINEEYFARLAVSF